MFQTKRELRLLIVSGVCVICLLIILQQTFRAQYPVIAISEKRVLYAPHQLKTTTQAPTLANKLQALLKCRDAPLEFERVQYGSYWLARNLVRGSISRSIGCAEAITYTTNGDYTFCDNLANVVSRWRAPVSFAIFAPGYDTNTTLESIQYVRNCLPESELIRQYVTFHVYFPATHMPSYLPLSEAEALNWPYDCDFAPYLHAARAIMYKNVHNLTYPINVGRNIARKSVNTYFVFACDIELYPSPGFVQQFLEMVVRNGSSIINGDVNKPRVFPLPVFELYRNTSLPHSKKELLVQLATKKAMPFHWRLCRYCHLMPNQTQWLNITNGGDLSVFAVGKRQGKYAYWEPFYISDNKEPMFDERVTWEGQSNKRIQGLAMCLLDYEYHVLTDGFLVHSPGIKYFDKNSTRLRFVGPMNKLIKRKIVPEYKILFGENKKCSV